jgi:hypothetical protein
MLERVVRRTAVLSDQHALGPVDDWTVSIGTRSWTFSRQSARPRADRHARGLRGHECGPRGVGPVILALE